VSGDQASPVLTIFEKLAEKMVREVFQPGEYSLSPHAILLPYAKAILKAQEALGVILRGSTSLNDLENDLGDDALAALRAITGKE
jgi:hypothetical protein